MQQRAELALFRNRIELAALARYLPVDAPVFELFTLLDTGIAGIQIHVHTFFSSPCSTSAVCVTSTTFPLSYEPAHSRRLPGCAPSFRSATGFPTSSVASPNRGPPLRLYSDGDAGTIVASAIAPADTISPATRNLRLTTSKHHLGQFVLFQQVPKVQHRLHTHAAGIPSTGRRQRTPARSGCRSPHPRPSHPKGDTTAEPGTSAESIRGLQAADRVLASGSTARSLRRLAANGKPSSSRPETAGATPSASTAQTRLFQPANRIAKSLISYPAIPRKGKHVPRHQSRQLFTRSPYVANSMPHERRAALAPSDDRSASSTALTRAIAALSPSKACSKPGWQPSSVIPSGT